MSSNNFCGTGIGGNITKPGDPSFSSVLSAKPAFGGIDVWWSYPESNPHAVAHTRLFRSLSGTDESPVLHTIVNGDFFYDKIEGSKDIEYFYWIQIVSINGTEGEMIGPVSAKANPTIAATIEGLTQAIDLGHLAQSLKQEIDRIQLNKLSIDQEMLDRAASDEGLAASITEMQAYSDETRAQVQEEMLARADADEAFVTTVNTLYADFNENLSAAVQTERQARTAADEALASQITTVQASANDSIASVEQRMETRLKDVGTWANSFEEGDEFDSWSAGAGSIQPERGDAWGGEQSALVRGGGSSPNSTGSTGAVRASIPAGRASLYSGRRVRVSIRAKRPPSNASNEFALAYSTDADGNSGWHKFSPTNSWEQYSFLYDMPVLSGQQDRYIGIWGDTSGGNGGVLVDSIFITPVANEDDLPGFGAMYTAQVDVNGLIGGFGVYNDGVSVEAGFDVDRFWIGRTNSNKRKPFIIDGGVVYVDEAAIQKLTFSKLRSENGSFIVHNGKMKAENVDVDNMVIRQGQSDNFKSGTRGWQLTPNGGEINFPISFGNVSGAGALAGKDDLYWGELKGSNKPQDNADRTSENTAKGIQGQGSFATRDFAWWNEIDGSGKPEDNADVTGNHTAKDTNNVAGRNANTVRDEARQGKWANDRKNEWTRPGSTLIDGNKIHTGDAYVDTLQIKGNAVTVPISARTNSSKVLTNQASWTTVQQLSINPEGGEISIWAFMQWHGMPDSWNYSVAFRILRNGNEIHGWANGIKNERVAHTMYHLGGSNGSTNIKLQVSFTGDSDIAVFDRQLFAIGTKR